MRLIQAAASAATFYANINQTHAAMTRSEGKGIRSARRGSEKSHGRFEGSGGPMKRKILIIVENSTAPEDPRTWKEARSLRDHGYDVTVLSPRSKRLTRAYEEIEGIRVYRHPIPRHDGTSLGYVGEYVCALLWEFLYTSWIFLRHGFHVIQGSNPPDDIFLVALIFKLLGVKYIFDHHDVNPELYIAKYGKKDLIYNALGWLEKLSYCCSDVVMATNASYRDLAVERGGLASEDVFIVRNGPYLDRCKAVQPNPTLKYHKPYLVGYVGYMSVQDGLDILLEVAEHIKNLGRRDIHFTCIGPGPELVSLRRMVREKDLTEMVNFTGWIPDENMLEILSTADVCVNPDRPCQMNNISTMIKIMEYMALSKPIVQFESKEGKFSAQEASLYASTHDRVADFARKILSLLDNPSERQRMGEFGRRRIELELAWQYSVPHLLAAYDRAFGKRALISWSEAH